MMLAASMQALPFSEPMTRLVYSRERRLDTSTGSGLTPHPVGYVDSANRYAFAAGDPINNSDLTGNAVATTGDGSFCVSIFRSGKRYLLPIKMG